MTAMSELPKNYDPNAIEEKWYNEWLAKGYFRGEASRGGMLRIVRPFMG